MEPRMTFKKDQLSVSIYSTDQEMGKAAASYSAGILQKVLQKKRRANLILATGASQFTFYEALKQINELEWGRITVFHLDEYTGMPETHPASFRRYLKERILDHVHPAEVHFLKGDAPDPEKEAERYASLLSGISIDLACIGIGENGHIAFNDPPVADFNDTQLVRNLPLDSDCRKQQLGEGWFSTLDEVPTHALSLTVPAIMRSHVISCVVPDARKSAAVYNTLHHDIDEACPATILRNHPNSTLFLDIQSASRLPGITTESGQ